MVLAHAGLRRLGLAHHATYVFPPEEMLPAVAQGALALEARADDAGRSWPAWRPWTTRPTRVQVEAERASWRASRAAARSRWRPTPRVEGEMVRLRALVASVDGTRLVRAERSGPRPRPGRSARRWPRSSSPGAASAILREAAGQGHTLSAPRRG